MVGVRVRVSMPSHLRRAGAVVAVEVRAPRARQMEGLAKETEFEHVLAGVVVAAAPPRTTSFD